MRAINKNDSLHFLSDDRSERCNNDADDYVSMTSEPRVGVKLANAKNNNVVLKLELKIISCYN